MRLPEPEDVPPENHTEPEESSQEEYADLAPMAPEVYENDDVDEGCLKLNTSLSSIGTEVHPEKRALPETKKLPTEKKSQKLREIKSTSDENGPKSPTRKSAPRRKTINRKGGSELSPFVFRRDGTIKFRNFDVEHRKREQSKVRKDTIKSSMFKFLDDGHDDDDDIAKLIEQSTPKKKSRKPAVGVPRTKLY